MLHFRSLYADHVLTWIQQLPVARATRVLFHLDAAVTPRLTDWINPGRMMCAEIFQ